VTTTAFEEEGIYFEEKENPAPLVGEQGCSKCF